MLSPQVGECGALVVLGKIAGVGNGANCIFLKSDLVVNKANNKKIVSMMMRRSNVVNDIPLYYTTSMKNSQKTIAQGVVHNVPPDLSKALRSDTTALTLWEGLTPLARNEWICWTISVKKEETRKEHVGRTITELKEGKRRPCCWIGCIHRTDKKISPSIQWVLSRKKKR